MVAAKGDTPQTQAACHDVFAAPLLTSCRAEVSMLIVLTMCWRVLSIMLLLGDQNIHSSAEDG